MDLPPAVASHLQEIRDLCRVAGVARLWIFGSAARGEWRAGESDLDFLVEFSSDRSRAEQFAVLYDGLERLLQVHFDLVSEHGVRNPFLRAELDDTRVLLHAAA